MSQYFSRENGVPNEGVNIDKRKEDLVGFRGSVARGGARSSSLLGTRSPDFTIKSRRWLRSPHGSSFAPHAAPHPIPPCPCTPQRGQTAVPLRLCWLHMLSSLCVVGVFKKKKEETCRGSGERWGGRLTFAARRVQGCLPAEARRSEWVSPPWAPQRRPHLGDALPAVPAGRVGTRGSPRSPSGAGRDHRARTEGGGHENAYAQGCRDVSPQLGLRPRTRLLCLEGGGKQAAAGSLAGRRTAGYR